MPVSAALTAGAVPLKNKKTKRACLPTQPCVVAPRFATRFAHRRLASRNVHERNVPVPTRKVWPLRGGAGQQRVPDGRQPRVRKSGQTRF